MAAALYLHTTLNVDDLRVLVSAFQKSFDEWLGDHFDDDELDIYADAIDRIAFVDVQPKLSELSVDDYSSPEEKTEKLRALFEACRSTITIAHLPYLESNPFQVTYLLRLLNVLGEILIDKDLEELLTKEELETELRRYRSTEALGPSVFVPKVQPSVRSFDPVTQMVTEIYNELKRLEVEGALPDTELVPSEKARKLYQVMRNDPLDPDSLLRITGLAPKDFGDHLEKLKFWLRKF